MARAVAALQRHPVPGQLCAVGRPASPHSAVRAGLQQRPGLGNVSASLPSCFLLLPLVPTIFSTTVCRQGSFLNTPGCPYSHPELSLGCFWMTGRQSTALCPCHGASPLQSAGRVLSVTLGTRTAGFLMAIPAPF